MSDLLERIYKLMENEGIKPAQLCKELKMSTSTFTDWGKGKGSPSLKAVVSFAEYFHVSLDYLVLGKENEHPIQFQASASEGKILNAFRQLSPELQQKAISYAEGMAAAMPESSPGSAKLSG